jgi:hypothetical protein
MQKEERTANLSCEDGGFCLDRGEKNGKTAKNAFFSSSLPGFGSLKQYLCG